MTVRIWLVWRGGFERKLGLLRLLRDRLRLLGLGLMLRMMLGLVMLLMWLGLMMLWLRLMMLERLCGMVLLLLMRVLRAMLLVMLLLVLLALLGLRDVRLRFDGRGGDGSSLHGRRVGGYGRAA